MNPKNISFNFAFANQNEFLFYSYNVNGVRMKMLNSIASKFYESQ